MTNTALTLGEASRATDKAKSTVLRAIEKGKISATKNDDGEWQIEPAELFRHFAPATPETVAETDEENDAQRDETPQETVAEVKRLRELLSTANLERDRERGQLEDQISDLRERLDREGEERRQLTSRLLADQRPPVPSASPPQRGGFFGLFRKAS